MNHLMMKSQFRANGSFSLQLPGAMLFSKSSPVFTVKGPGSHFSIALGSLLCRLPSECFSAAEMIKKAGKIRNISLSNILLD